MADDSYAPYYPGDDAVDWVGMSLYHWGATYPWGENELPEANKFTDQLTGTYVGANGDDSLLPDFYARVRARSTASPWPSLKPRPCIAPAPAVRRRWTSSVPGGSSCSARPWPPSSRS